MLLQNENSNKNLLLKMKIQIVAKNMVVKNIVGQTAAESGIA